MPIQVNCPCGKTLRLRDDLAGMRVKCPECGAAIDVPEEGASASPFLTETDAEYSPPKPVVSRSSSRSPDGTSITGKPVNGYNGLHLPTLFGTSELTIGKTRLIEDTKKLFSSRYAEFLLTDIESAEISTHRNPLYLILGMLTLGLFGFGLLFLLVYFFLKYKSLIIHSTSHGAVIGIKGDDTPYYDFLNEVLLAAENAKK